MRDSSVNWQVYLAQGFASARDLLDFLQLADTISCGVSEQEFATRVPLSFAKRMQKSNPNDPLLLQVLAQPVEQQQAAGYTKDPLQENQKNPVAGLIHKYHGRVLLIVTGVCAINCRFCFRRHFPYAKNNPGRVGWQKAFAYIQSDQSINEVIFSGGDPLLATDNLLAYLVAEIVKIKHVKTLRIHSRIPIVLPERITQSLLDILSNSGLQIVMVIHCNHPQELDADVFAVCKSLRNIGCYLLNQTVLLKNVNDSVEVLAQLSHKLFAGHILPYYLHVLDKTQGTEHFEVSCVDALAIFAGLQIGLPGYLLPKLVMEEPHKRSKTLLL